MHVGRGVITAAVAVGCNIAGSRDIDSREASNPPSKSAGYNVVDYRPHNNNPICECAAFPQHLGVLEGRNFPEALALYCPPRRARAPYVIEQRVPTDEKQWAHVEGTL